MIALRLIAGLGGVWLFGLGVVLLAMTLTSRRDSQRTGRLELAGWSLLAGLGLTCWLQFLWGLTGGSLTATIAWTTPAIGWIWGASTAGLRLIRAHRLETPSGTSDTMRAKDPEGSAPEGSITNASNRHTLKTSPPGPQRSAALKLSLLVITGIFIASVAQTLLTPQRFWDERAIFAIKARVLYIDGRLDSEALHHPHFGQYHPRYPLLLPLAEQTVMQWADSGSDRWPKVVVPVMFFGLVLSVTGVLSRTISPAWGGIAGLLLATVPAIVFWEYGILSAQADAPLACLHGAAILSLWDWLKSHSAAGGESSGLFPALLGGLFSGLALFTKDEGIAFLLVDGALVSMLLATGGRHVLRRAMGPGLVAASTVAIVILPWLIYRGQLPATTEMSYAGRLSLQALRDGLPALQWSLLHLAGLMFLSPWPWGLQWWGMALAIALRPQRLLRRPQLLLLGDVAGAIAALVVAGMIAPTPVQEHIGGSAHRFLIQISPVAVLFLAAQLGEPNRSAPDLQSNADS